ncbi:MAG: hypothetical protein ACE5F4_02700 [Candidatus Paceibacteria bacterium]
MAAFFAFLFYPRGRHHLLAFCAVRYILNIYYGTVSQRRQHTAFFKKKEKKDPKEDKFPNWDEIAPLKPVTGAGWRPTK